MTASLTSSARSWLGSRFATRVERMLTDLAADRVPATRVLLLGGGDVAGGAPDTAEVRALLTDRFGPALSTDPAAGGFDLVVSLGELGRADDPAARLRELVDLTSKHLLLVEPRAPFSRGPVTSWTLPGLQRLVSEVASVREVATPLPTTLVWAVRL